MLGQIQVGVVATRLRAMQGPKVAGGRLDVGAAQGALERRGEIDLVDLARPNEFVDGLDFVHEVLRIEFGRPGAGLPVFQAQLGPCLCLFKHGKSRQGQGR